MLSDIMFNILLWFWKVIHQLVLNTQRVKYYLETPLQHDIPVRKYLFEVNNKYTETRFMDFVQEFLWLNLTHMFPVYPFSTHCFQVLEKGCIESK